MDVSTQPLNATFFTLQHRDRAVLLPATLLMIVWVALVIAAFVALNWGFFAQLLALMQQGTSAQMPDDQAAAFAMRLMTLVFSVFLFLFPLYMVLAAYEAACLRWMLRGEVPGLFGFALDHDMWRVYGVYWCWLILQFAVSLAVSIITTPFVFMTMGDIMNDPSPETMLHWQLSVQLPLAVLQYIPLIFLGVRFAPAAAASIARKRFSFLDAWTVTRGRFWAVFGSLAVLLVLFFICYIAIAIGVAYAVFGAPLFEALASFPDLDGPRLERLVGNGLTPQALGVAAIGYAGVLVLWIGYALMSFGVNARAALAALEEGKIARHVETD